MNTLEKVKVLGEAGRWDTCASTASKRPVVGMDRVGNVAAGGICHSFTPDGRCVSLYKTLMTNDCALDCRYCQNSTRCGKRRIAEYEPNELAKVFMHLYLTNHVEGLFLSSGISGDADATTEKMLESIRLLRNQYRFQGYVHFKALPGVSRELIKQAGEVSDRLSINLEAPGKSRLAQITDVKDYNVDIIRRQRWIKGVRPPSGQTTQLVVGSADESDLEILEAARWEYESMRLKRVYYSAFTPIEDTPLADKKETPLQREHRLYQTDFMMRKYGIRLSEFKDIMDDDNLPKGDPKVHLALHSYNGPVDVNEAPYDELIRVPGMGPVTVNRIMDLRRRNVSITKFSQLKSMGVVLKRATPFIKVNGRVQRRMVDYGV
jgi:putative DNA modification/repair radical SAM protein